MRRIATFAEFWPHYLREHSRPATRAWHYAGTTLSIACLVAGVITGRGQLFLAVPLSGYLFAWMAHAFIERNRPATFQYPLWSLAADFVMYGCWISGQMPRQLARAGVR